MAEFTLIKNYFSNKYPPFNTNDYFNKFITSNVIVNAISNHISFTRKKSGLSLKCAFNGSEFYETHGCRFRIDDKSYLVLNREQEYYGYVESSTDVETFSLFFEKDMADNVLSSMLAKSYEEIIDYYESGGSVQPILFIEKTYCHDRVISPVLFNLRNSIRNDITDKLYLEEQFHLILSLLFNIHKNIICEIRNFPSIKPSTKMELYKRLNRSKDYMDASYNKNISLKAMASKACLSPHHFLRLFKKIFSYTPHQYLTLKRLEFAKILLRESSLNISEICVKTGYENLSTFSRIFKQHYSASPENYRNLNPVKKSISVK